MITFLTSRENKFYLTYFLLALAYIVHISITYGLASGIDYVFENKYCDFIFRCGCTWDWAGGWNKCNVHNHSLPDRDKCPFCNAKGSVVVLTWFYIWTIVLYWIIFLVQKRYWAPREIIEKNKERYGEAKEPLNDTERFIGLERHEDDEEVVGNGFSFKAFKVELYESIFPYTILQFLFRLLMASHSYFIFGAVTGFFFKVGTGYPHFLWWSW